MNCKDCGKEIINNTPQNYLGNYLWYCLKCGKKKHLEFTKDSEQDRIYKEFEEVLDLDYFRWILSYCRSKLKLEDLKHITLDNWKHDVNLWNNMNRGGYKTPEEGGIYIAGYIPKDGEDDINE